MGGSRRGPEKASVKEAPLVRSSERQITHINTNYNADINYITKTNINTDTIIIIIITTTTTNIDNDTDNDGRRSISNIIVIRITFVNS